MYGAVASTHPIETIVAAMLAGWIAERSVDTGMKSHAVAPVAGFLGLYIGHVLWTWGGWNAGPTIGGFPVAPLCAGAFAVCGVLKLVRLGVAGPRW